MTVHERTTRQAQFAAKPTADLRRPRATFLRWVLRLDGAVGVVIGLAYLLAASPLGDLLGLPTAVLMAEGAFLLAWGLVLATLSVRSEVARSVVLGLIALDAVWVLDSVFVALSGWFTPSLIGTEWIVVQAVAAAAMGALKYIGLRRALS